MGERKAKKVANGAACDARGRDDAACAAGTCATDTCATGACVRNALIRLGVAALALFGVAWATGREGWAVIGALSLFVAAALWGLDAWRRHFAGAGSRGM